MPSRLSIKWPNDIYFGNHKVIIHLANGDPRLAFQKTITSKEK